MDVILLFIAFSSLETILSDLSRISSCGIKWWKNKRKRVELHTMVWHSRLFLRNLQKLFFVEAKG